MDLSFQNSLTSNLIVTDKKVDCLFELQRISSILIDEMERRQRQVVPLGAGWFLAQLTHWATSYPLFALRALALGDSQVTGDRVNIFKDL